MNTLRSAHVSDAVDYGKAAHEAHKRAVRRVVELQRQLDDAERDLHEATRELDAFRKECGRCDDCSACLG